MAIFDGWFGLNGLFGKRAKLTEPDARAAAEAAQFGQPITPDTAMKLATVWACVRLLSESIGTLPLGVYTKGANGGRQEASDHALYSLLHDSPNADQSAVEFWESCVACLALWGNFYAEKVMLGQRIVALNIVRPDLMNVYRNRAGARCYRWTQGSVTTDVGEENVFHVRGFGVGLDTGLSPIGYARSTLGAAMAADRSAASAFQNAVRPSGLLVTPPNNKLTSEQRIQIKQTILDPLTGPENTARAALLEGGWDWKNITGGLPPEDLQLLQTRSFHVEELCRWFRVPPFMIGHTEKSTSWGTGLEQQMIGFLTFSLRPYLSRIEQAVKKQLVHAADRPTVYAEFNLEGLLRADSTGRAALYASAAQNGWRTRNEIRALENLPALAGGDDLTVQSNLVPISLLGKQPPAAIGHNGGPPLDPQPTA